ncbi:MAG: hypothetical protein AB2A00_15175 [Myxococcota bacterium]
MKSARLALLVLLASCTNERLETPRAETRQAVDNRVTVEADFCTAEPEQQIFPVKIMLVMDASGSLQFLDEGGLRVSAVRALLSRYEGDPAVSFNIIQFNSLLYQSPDLAQVPDDQLFANPVDISDTQLQLAEVQTDYQAALSRAYSTLLADMTASGNIVRNTKYVVIFFSDGQPSPVCCPCEEETAQPDSATPFTCDANGNPDPPPPSTNLGGLIFEQRYCEGQQELPICNLTDPNLVGRFADAYAGLFDANGDGNRDDYDGNGSYNRGYQIDQLMRDIVDLANTFEVGAFQFHTVLLYNPNLPPAVQAIVQVNYDTSSARLTEMARIGGGTYVEARNAADLDFLKFDFNSVKRTFGLRRAFVVNLNAAPGAEGPLVDSDGDGLDDALEDAEGLHSLRADSDGDGYRDLIEWRMRDRGLDGRNAQAPYSPCTLRNDDDLDLLEECEELMLGTNPLDADTDHDAIPDGLELRFDLDPLKPDAELDYDFDGVANGEEVGRHTNPRIDDPKARERASYRYTLQDQGQTVDRRQCFGFQARNIQLMSTVGRDGVNQPGWNDLHLVEIEAPEDNATGQTFMRLACFRGRYISPDFKEPVDGTYRRLRDAEVKSTLLPGALDKCWGPQLTPVNP